MLEAAWLKQLCLDTGADDVGFVGINRSEIDEQREDILKVFPGTKALISFVCRMNREPIRSPARSIANLEFHHVGDKTNEVARKIVFQLECHGIRAINPSVGFPMEMNQFPGKIWTISHKPIAVAASLGMMGIHRNVIHPKFGNFILLGTILIDQEISETSKPLDYNPCLECKLCVAACPVGAIGSDGHFNFSACYTHNYREFMGGFTDWVENIVESRDARDYRERIEDTETVSLWQSLSYGANYKSAYCMAVCPAGEDVIGPYLENKPKYMKQVLSPLQEREEPLYVIPDSDAEAHAKRRFPHKKIRRVGNGIRVGTIKQFLGGLPLVFQPQKSAGLNATYHFTFTGKEVMQATVIIQNKSLHVELGHFGSADLKVTADSQSWLKFLAGEMNIIWALLFRKVRLKGSPRLLLAFGSCCPS
ncbi:MAG: SCP2 sterol-binding domain-containing protein [Gammaproteobacteria bacterium]|nr:SCP2 sterol-binding domain-containing protein [Gammaproteobacteria bacterium]